MTTQDHADRDAARSAFSDPYQVAAALNLEKGAKRQRDGLLVVCPAHGDRGPSCSLTRGQDGTLRVRCFGACGLKGDVFDLIAAVHRLSPSDFPHAVKIALDLAGKHHASASTERAPSLPPLDGPTFDAVARAVLCRAPIVGDVARYLDARGILGLAIQDEWGGLPTFTKRLVESVACEFDRDTLTRSGLFAPCKDRPDVLRFVRWHHRLVIPWRAQDGRITTLQRRDIRPDDQRRGQEKYVFPRGYSPSEPYGVHAFVDSADHVVVVEGATDTLAARMLARGKPNIIGIPGVSAWPVALPFCDGRDVTLAFDADSAGDAAATAMREHLAVRGVACTRVRPKDAKDWTDVLTRRKGAQNDARTS